MALDLREAEAWDSPATAAGLAWERVNLKARPWEKHSFRGLGDGWVLFRASSFQPPFLPEHTSPQLPFTRPISPVPAFHSAHISDTLKTQEKGVPSAIQAGQCSGGERERGRWYQYSHHTRTGGGTPHFPRGKQTMLFTDWPWGHVAHAASVYSLLLQWIWRALDTCVSHFQSPCSRKEITARPAHIHVQSSQQLLLSDWCVCV